VRGAEDLTIFICGMSWKSGSLNLVETSGPQRACYGIPSSPITPSPSALVEWFLMMYSRNTYQFARLHNTMYHNPHSSYLYNHYHSTRHISNAVLFYHPNTPPWTMASSLTRFSRSHTTTYQSVGLLWTSDQPIADTST
jgi:hypothetical protein